MQKWSGPGTAKRIDRFVRGLFASLGDCRWFLFATGCNVSPQTPYENLIAFRDATGRHGREDLHCLQVVKTQDAPYLWIALVISSSSEQFGQIDLVHLSFTALNREDRVVDLFA